MSELLELLAELIRFESISPQDAGCQQRIREFLEPLGFRCESLDSHPVANLFAQFGEDSPSLLLAGHTDVVATGPLEHWDSSPFTLTEREGNLYGRGVADMKGGLAAMLIAAKHFLAERPNLKSGFAFLITSGEEGEDYEQGTAYAMKQLYERGYRFKHCILGEPSSQAKIGDMIRVGRRGSLSGELLLRGKQGHVAYPDKACNPIHLAAPAIKALSELVLDQGNAYFPPSQLQITQLSAGGLGANVIPGELKLDFNIRFSTEQSAAGLQAKIESLFQGLDCDIHWRLSGQPFLTEQGDFLKTVVKTIEASTGISPELSTSGGTSDGRFIAPYGVELVELGLPNASIHQINECCSREDLEQLCQLYTDLLRSLLLKQQ